MAINTIDGVQSTVKGMVTDAENMDMVWTQRLQIDVMHVIEKFLLAKDPKALELMRVRACLNAPLCTCCVARLGRSARAGLLCRCMHAW